MSKSLELNNTNLDLEGSIQDDRTQRESLKDSGESLKSKSRSKGHRKKLSDEGSLIEEKDKSKFFIEIQNPSPRAKRNTSSSPSGEAKSDKSLKITDKSKRRPERPVTVLGKVNGARKASHTWDPDRQHLNEDMVATSPRPTRPSNTLAETKNAVNANIYKEKASTWSFAKSQNELGTTGSDMISVEKGIDVEWLGRHVQIIPDLNTYEELVSDVAKEFRIDLEFLNEMYLELTFKSLNSQGKKRRINAENFASEFKKVTQLLVSVVDQSQEAEASKSEAASEIK